MTLENFLQLFKKFIGEKELFLPSDKVLLAISGGMDSMLMAWAFHTAGLTFSIAHCNFNLRGMESDADEDLVRAIAAEYGVAFHTKRFDTKAFAMEQGISTQMAARDLRYSWFEEICMQHSCIYTCLAQHAGDLTETILINLLRGTGIAGLHGIQSVHNKLIRPFLFLNKDQIKELVALAGINYREDASNLSTNYVRNKLRLEVIPVLRQINPSLEETFRANAARMASTERMYLQRITMIRDELLEPAAYGYRICIHKILSFGQDTAFVLYELLKEFEFSEAVCDQVTQGLHRQSGKVVTSPGFCLTRDREFLMIERTNIQETMASLQSSFRSDFPKEPAAGDYGNRFIACLDADLLEHSLIYRFWEPGDSFMPLGMKKKKKLSDFFIDMKVPLTEKKRIPLVLSGTDIIWIAGYRIDERYKITEKTRQIIRLRYMLPE